MNLRRKSDGAAHGESGVSPVQASGEPHVTGAVSLTAVNGAPLAGASWDPYEVWLTRVKQPREQSARQRVQEQQRVDQPLTQSPVESSARPTPA